MTSNSGDIYRFGPFEVHSSDHRVLRGGVPVELPPRHVDVLLLLMSNAGVTVTKDAIVAAAWPDVAVGDNSVARVISDLRRVLGDAAGTQYIETRARRGYRFVAPVERSTPPPPEVSLDAIVARHLPFVDGRAALETLDCDEVVRARRAFEGVLASAPDHPRAHLGLANACVLAFESTRTDVSPDVAALHKANHYARATCRLSPSSADAWSTLAFVLHRSGSVKEAVTAASEAVAREPGRWQHHLRLACVTWGDQRLRAVYDVDRLCEGVAFAHWFAATVYIARGAVESAFDRVRAGCAAQDAECADARGFRAVGSHLLHGLLLFERGDNEGALEEFAREMAAASERQVYGRECLANTSYATGAVHLRVGRRDAAEAAFRATLTHVPGHPCATAALSGGSAAPVIRPGMPSVDAALIHAVGLALAGRHDEAARVCGDALTQAGPGPGGWMIPIEPLLHVSAHRDLWAGVLATLRHGAR